MILLLLSPLGDLKVSLKPIVGKNDKCFRRDILQVFDIIIVVTC